MSLLISLQIKVGSGDNTCTSRLLENCVQKLTFDVASLLFVDEITVHLKYRKLYHLLDNYCIEYFRFVSGNLDNIASTQVADKLQRLLFNYAIKANPLLCRLFTCTSNAPFYGYFICGSNCIERIACKL